jgi:hypothetical protein
MEFISLYWPQLIAFVAVVIALTTIKVDVEHLKQKVKTLFELWNQGK